VPLCAPAEAPAADAAPPPEPQTGAAQATAAAPVAAGGGAAAPPAAASLVPRSASKARVAGVLAQTERATWRHDGVGGGSCQGGAGSDSDFAARYVPPAPMPF